MVHDVKTKRFKLLVRFLRTIQATLESEKILLEARGSEAPQLLRVQGGPVLPDQRIISEPVQTASWIRCLRPRSRRPYHLSAHVVPGVGIEPARASQLRGF